jgi:two-component system sensor histidine kinase CpxA
MKTFFLQLFLSFWVAAIGIFVASSLIYPDSIPGPVENFRAAGDATNRRIADDTIAAFQTGGCDAVRRANGAYLLMTLEAQPICGESITPEEQALARRAMSSRGFGQRGHIGSWWVEVKPASSSDSRRWLLLERTRYIPGLGLPPLPRDGLPLSIAVTLIFSFLLLQPIRKLSVSFRRLAAGDLTVRLPVSKHWWSSIGGADVRNLMLDFNHMVDRINGLIEAQKLLLRDISHELRSPLARLRLAIEMTREEAHEELPTLDRMETEADRVNELIGQILSLSLMESTKQLTHGAALSIQEVVESLLPDMEFEAHARGCNIQLEAKTHIPPTSGNWELLHRAFENVLRNAIRFTAPGTAVEIEISEIYSLQYAGQAVQVRVSDRGPGVPDASLPLIFRAFYRTDTSRGESTGGFGVGLSIAERAVALHGGIIVARNRSGGGLEMEILLPVNPQS